LKIFLTRAFSSTYKITPPLSLVPPHMVKELDLFESNNGCGMNGLSSEKHS